MQFDHAAVAHHHPVGRVPAPARQPQRDRLVKTPVAQIQPVVLGLGLVKFTRAATLSAIALRACPCRIRLFRNTHRAVSTTLLSQRRPQPFSAGRSDISESLSRMSFSPSPSPGLTRLKAGG